MLNNKNRYSLLYVEDDIDTREMVVEYLEEFFKEIYEAGNGVEALEIYEKCSPDIIITDIEMPKMNGLKLASKIRKEDKNTPIIITTAYTSLDYLLEAIGLNLIKYLIKPIKEDELEKAIEQCYQYVENQNSSVIVLTEEISYDAFNHTLSSNKKIIPLTSSQVQLLDLLIKNRHRVVTYQEIENHLWYDKVMSESALRSLIYDLRKLIGKGVIENISKTGYKIYLYE